MTKTLVAAFAIIVLIAIVLIALGPAFAGAKGLPSQKRWISANLLYGISWSSAAENKKVLAYEPFPSC
jgi:hypothetical protein